MWFRLMNFKKLSAYNFLISLLFTSWAAQAEPTAKRIISLAPSLTELVYSAGAGDQLVGVVNYSDYPEAALSVPIVGSYNALNFEVIMQLKPDLVLAWQSGNRPQDLDRLKRLGLNLLIRDTQRLDDIANLIEEIGRLSQQTQTASAEANRLRQQLNQLRTRYQHAPKVRVFYQVWHQPTITINGEQFISQAIEVCGGQNVFADLSALAPHVNREAVIQKNPDMILLGGLDHVQQKWLEDWQKIPQLKAVQNDHIYPLNADHFQRPTARLIDALDNLCQLMDQARTQD
ncbi:cobalamin-binding protein [Thiomicrospira sp.]|uniref:cobalamin-binding protein n=1 Tax=Thiomicrospira sp. TaxID=935 RepID=UPI0025EDA431|nr:cobalamin-binding protein [Thiomicrospira sp.]